MALIDDITAQLAQYQKNPYSTANASNAVNAINSNYTSSLIDQLNSLRNKYSGMLNDYQNQLGKLDSTYKPIFDTLNTNIGNAKTENQDILNANADSLQTALRNIQEQQANGGNLYSGQTPLLQLQANTARQNNDTKIYNQRASDVNNYTNQLNAQKGDYASKQNDINTNINSANSQGESDLASLLSSIGQQRNAAVQNQLASEASAAYDAQLEQQKLAEQQYEAQVAAQAKLASASSGSSSSRSGSSSSSSGSSGASQDVANAQTVLNALGFNAGSVDGVQGNQTTSAIVAFQKAHGLTPDGVLGPETLSRITLMGTGVGQPGGAAGYTRTSSTTGVSAY